MWIDRMLRSNHWIVVAFLLVSVLSGFDDHGLVESKKTSTSTDNSVPNSGGNHQQKSVKITLTSKWKQTPFLLEIAEFLSEENPDLFWSFIELLEHKFGPNGIGSLTTKEQYDVGLQFADQLLRSESKLSILKFSLSLRSYSPTVAMFQQITDDIMAHSLNSSDSLQNCDSFVELSFGDKLLEDSSVNKYRRYSCQLEDVRQSIQTLLAYLKQNPSESELRHPLLYSIDHQYPVGSQSKRATVILYGNIGTPSFFQLHQALKEIVSSSEGSQLRYAVRHYYVNSNSAVVSSAEKVGLSGYGVELAIKSTEYKQQDDTRVRGEAVTTKGDFTDSEQEQKPDQVSGFVFSKLRDSFPDQHEKLSEFQNYLIDTDKEIATLKVWELQEISLQAATKVMSVNKDEALKLLKDIAQNFPSVARSLAKISVDSDLKKEILKNQYYFMQNLNLGTTDSALFINGLYYDVDSVDVFSLFDLIKQEQDVVDKLYRLLNGDSEKIRKFIKLDVSFEKQDYQIDIRDGSVNYVNNIEEDRNYRNWPQGLHEMLRPSYPGMMRSVRRNIFHLVLVVDPSQKSSHDIIQMAESFYLYKAPVRIGLVFAVNQNTSVTGMEDAGVACLEAFNYISQEKTPYEALSFLTDLIAKAQSTKANQDSGTESGNLKPEYVLEHFKAKIRKNNLEDIFGADSEFDTGRQLAWDFVIRTGIGAAPKALLNGVLLKDSYLNLNYFEDVVLSEVMKQTTPLQKAIYKGEISDDEESVLDWLMSKETVMPRLNRIILGIDPQQSALQSKIVDFSGTAQKLTPTTDYHQMNVKDVQASVVNTVRYINTKQDSPNPVTVWLVSDFSSSQNRHIFLAALAHLRQNSNSMRLAPIYQSYSVFNRITEAAFQSFGTSPKQLIQFMQKFILYSIENSDHSDDETVKKIFDFIPEEFRSSFNEKYEKLLPNSEQFQLYSEFCSRILNLSPNDFVVILNGKVYRVPHTEPFIEADFSLMEKFINNLITDKVMPLLTDKELQFGGGAGVSARKGSDLILKISAALLGKSQSKTRYDVGNIREDHSVLLLEPRNTDQPFVELSAVLDPLSRGAQKISPILDTLYQVFNARIKIYFNCVDKHSDMPLKSFYRFVLDKEPQFDSASGDLLQPSAQFGSMPKTPLFTLGMAVPENWLVEAVEAVHDLDNIHLEQIEGNTVSAIFELEHLLVEGHCFEQSSGTPPRGLQFTLGTESNPVMFDTIVMANLGYFQLKANPGIWMLKLRQGRSDDIYTIVSHEGGTDQLVANASEVIPIVSNFRSLVIKIRVNKKPGKQNEELLFDSDESSSAESGGDNSLWSSFSWGSDDAKKKSADGTESGSNLTSSEDEDSKRINIFSLASGHLYERLLRIMMTSVLKQTKTPVKFWFLKNYLSPNFKNVLPFMAQKYRFDYELVEYKWPRWLHQQTEKQRIIWGYKILFLDVLFPLDVKKIIFVDADQVVRADLKELRDLDLEGAPYGYTPFCDSRKDMDGFRFWKSGYWQTHLHGRKYHISALYVVDLQKFRRIAAGDRLRGQYQGLSQDPNSLSNLDQDLPNNMIHQVAIKSLPQEWLWCETWCSDESKKKAKTIDLCNNPKTKEPKLTGARRIVAEWEDYDNELKKMMDEYNNQKKSQSNNLKPAKVSDKPQKQANKVSQSDKAAHQEL